MSVWYFVEPLIAGLLLSFVAWSAGLRWARRARIAVSPAGEWGLATALGLALAGVGGYVLALLGWLRPMPVALLAGALVTPGLPIALQRLSSLRLPSVAGWGIALIAGMGVALALYPPLAFDETLYHLPMARAFARTGAMPFLPDLRLPACPALFEVLAAQVLLFDGDRAPHLLSWLSVTATAALLVDWGQRRGTAFAGQWAAALYVGSPLVVYLGTTAYVEPLLSLLATASLSTLDAWRDRREAWAIATAALLAGACASTKYLGLFLVATVLTALAWAVVRHRLRRQAWLAAAIIVATVTLSYGRVLWLTGNPLFPFLASVFGASEWSYSPHEPIGERLVGWLRAPFDAVFMRARVGGQPPVSPFYLLTLPLIVLAGSAFSRAVLALTALYAMLLPVHVRYLLPAAPALALAATSAVARWRGSAWLAHDPWRTLLTVLLLLPSIAWAGYHITRLGPPPASAEARHRFLVSRVPGYEALAFLNRAHGPAYTVYAAYAENLHDYAEGRFLGDWQGPRSFAKMLGAPDSDELHRRLRRAGAEYLLVPRVEAAAGIDALARGSPLFREVFRGGTATVYALVTDGRDHRP